MRSTPGSIPRPPVRVAAPRIYWVTDSPRGKAATGRAHDAVQKITGESPRTAGERGPGTQSSLAAESWGDRCLRSITMRSCLSAAVGSSDLKRAQVWIGGVHRQHMGGRPQFTHGADDVAHEKHSHTTNTGPNRQRKMAILGVSRVPGNGNKATEMGLDAFWRETSKLRGIGRNIKIECPENRRLPTHWMVSAQKLPGSDDVENQPPEGLRARWDSGGLNVESSKLKWKVLADENSMTSTYRRHFQYCVRRRHPIQSLKKIKVVKYQPMVNRVNNRNPATWGSELRRSEVHNCNPSRSEKEINYGEALASEIELVS
ncbi:hypothetical protein K438DRAFT_1947750 [Mycena galopus ATCC 62051]|nr:hypothetical protein K438DRAFT_1947750 [Mycena galopus ATCC 62051]